MESRWSHQTYYQRCRDDESYLFASTSMMIYSELNRSLRTMCIYLLFQMGPSRNVPLKSNDSICVQPGIVMRQLYNSIWSIYCILCSIQSNILLMFTGSTQLGDSEVQGLNTVITILQMSSNGISRATEGKKNPVMVSYQFPFNRSHLKSQPGYCATMINLEKRHQACSTSHSLEDLTAGSIAEKLRQKAQKSNYQGWGRDRSHTQGQLLPKLISQLCLSFLIYQVGIIKYVPQMSIVRTTGALRQVPGT